MYICYGCHSEGIDVNTNKTCRACMEEADEMMSMVAAEIQAHNDQVEADAKQAASSREDACL